MLSRHSVVIVVGVMYWVTSQMYIRNYSVNVEAHFFKDKEFLMISLDPVMENIILAMYIASPE